MKMMQIAIVTCVLVLLQACASKIPYRTESLNEMPSCRQIYQENSSNGEIGDPDNKCWKRSIEERAEYDMLFIEYDDQGWVQGAALNNKDNVDHLDKFLDKLNIIINKNKENGVSLVLFVHGWHHNAGANDRNVRDFRALLKDISKVEGASKHRRVVGLFVGWRGESVNAKFINDLTFWERKNTAEKVAQGSVRELFSRLDQIRDTNKGVTLLTIGHSFGGLIAFNATNPVLISAIAKFKDKNNVGPDGQYDCQSVKDYFSRLGDLVVIANPAYEGSRYEALAAAAKRVNCIAKDQWPVLITAVSQADLATKIAFPLARRLNTFWEYKDGDEHDATIKTVGFNRRYVTHELKLCDPDKGECLGRCSLVMPPKNSSEDLRGEYLLGELNYVVNNASAPMKSVEYFCDELMLTSAEAWTPTGNPFWVVSTSGQIMDGHNDIFNEKFVSFIRQIYVGVISALERKP